ncbi:MAG: hypothetical protein AAGG01_11020, partial [Planctomycetota bacterium]
LQLPAYTVISEAVGDAAQPGEVRRYLDIRGGEDSGWIATVQLGRYFDPVNNAFFGAFSATDPLGPRLLREPATLAGVQQYAIMNPSLAAGRIAYLTRGSVGSSPIAAWLDDEPIAQLGMPAGQTGRNWEWIDSVQLATDGTAIVEGGLDGGPGGGPGGAGSSDVIMRFPDGEVLLESGAPVAGTGETIGDISIPDRAPDGSALLARVRLSPSSREAVVLDGELFTFPGGEPAIAGNDARSALLLSVGTAEFTHYSFLHITSAGEVVFRCEADTNLGERIFVARNGKQTHLSLEDLDESGDIASTAIPEAVSEQGLVIWGGVLVRFPFTAIEKKRLSATEPGYGVDIDGDGSADPGWVIGNQTFVLSTSAFARNGELHALATIRRSGQLGSRRDVVVAVRLIQGDSVLCAGSANSTAAPAHLISVGSDDIAFNRMELYAIGLGQNRVSLPLLSLTPGAGVIPTGSVGTLCLGGAIGRNVFQPLVADFGGVARNDLFLNAMPQPDGPIAAQPGDTWYAQLWYRDFVQGAATSNFSDAIRIQFR